MIDLALWGFTGRFPALAAQYPELLPGRILSQEKGEYRLIFQGGERGAAISGKFRFAASELSDYPAVGDFVMIDDNKDGAQAVIHRVLPRKSAFIRRAAGAAVAGQVVAANVDTVFICMSLNNDFNLRRLERYLSAAWDSGASPVIVLTKADLTRDLPSLLAGVSSVAAGTDTVVTSALDEGGCSALWPYISQKGRTVGFIGSSGVGKSTLINRLLGEDRLATNGLRDDDKGRHTSTRRELLLLPAGSLVIDTPGMRELGMFSAGEGLERTFADIEALAASCRFKDCTHSSEPGCAVRAAMESGALDPARWASYNKLRTENAFSADNEGYLAAKNRKFKEIARINKASKKSRADWEDR